MIIAGALILGGAGAGGAWYFSQPTAPADEEDSVRTLAANALGTAREAAVFFRESAKRDMASLATLLRETTEDGKAEAKSEADEATEKEAAGVVQAVVAPPPLMGPSVNELIAGASGPALIDGGAIPSMAGVGTEPPLFKVFDASYPEVIPPGAEGIRIPRSSFGDMWISEAATPDSGLVEVVVSSTGDVEMAKLITSPANVHESMFLSAVKAWQFSPAQLDGQGVRYRQRMHIAVSR